MAGGADERTIMDALTTKSNRPQKYTSRAQVIGEIRDEIRHRLLSGEWKPGMVLPSRRALVPLIEDNLLISDGRGTFVSETAQELLRSSAAGAQTGGGALDNSMSSLMQNTIVLVSLAESTARGQRYAAGWATVIDDGVLDAVRRLGLHAMTLTKDTVQEHELQHIIETRPLGVVSSDMFGKQGAILKHLTDGNSLNVPVTMFGDLPEGAQCDSVVSDHNEGAYLLTQWLIDRGCKRILMLLPAEEPLGWMQDRRAGFERAMNERGIVPEPAINVSISSTDPVVRERFDYLTRLVAGSIAPYLLADNPADAIMALSDADVASISAACRLLRREPNVDVTIVGYDNYWSETDESQWESTPPMATVDKGNYEIGQELVRLTVARARGELSEGPVRSVITPRLVVLSEVS